MNVQAHGALEGGGAQAVGDRAHRLTPTEHRRRHGPPAKAEHSAPAESASPAWAPAPGSAAKTNPERAAEAEAAPLAPAKVTEAVEQLNEIMETFGKGIRFAVGDDGEDAYVQVVDPSTQEVVRELPSPEIREMMARVREAIGMIVDVQA